MQPDVAALDPPDLEVVGTRSDVGPVHGTGCALSAAITARLARGESLEAAARGAKDWVARAIAASQVLGRGARLLRLGPTEENLT